MMDSFVKVKTRLYTGMLTQALFFFFLRSLDATSLSNTWTGKLTGPIPANTLGFTSTKCFPNPCAVSKTGQVM